MEIQINDGRITTVTGDITKQPDIDVIVNAANKYLKGGSGVCGAIFKAAGWDALSRECWKHPAINIHEIRCPTGEARLTSACDLPNKGIIHAVGPIYNPAALLPGQNAYELKGAYLNSLELAAKNGFTSIAFPAISCGIYRYPLEEASRIAMETCAEWLAENSDQASVKEIRFVFLAFADGPELQEAFENALTTWAVNL